MPTNKKISELPAATLPVVTGAKFEALQGGINVQVDAADMPGAAAGVTSVTGTTNRITSTGGATPVINIDAAYDAAITAQIAAAAVGLWDDRGTFDASVAAYPSSGGSGTAGAILKGDIWTISVAGTLPTGQVVEIGDTVRALIDTPGNTQANWAILQNNIGFVPAPIASPTLTGVPAGPTAAPGTNTTQLATTAFVIANAVFVETATIYVDAAGNDSTGILGRADKPFLSITAALAAGVGVASLRIKIGMGLFGSPSSANLRGNLWLEGSGKPGYNNTYTQTAFGAVTISDPTALVGGTILTGTLFFQDDSNVHITDLGVDVGSAYVTAGGTEGNQIAFLSATVVANWTLMTNIVIKNVTTLGRTAGSLFHGIQCENCFKPLIVNCDTYFSTHGIVLKSYGGMAVNVRCNFHTANAVVYKTDTYAFGWLSQLHNFEIQGGGGILIDVGTGTSSGGVNSVKVSNGVIRSATFGFRTNSTVGTPAWVHYVDVNNVKVHGSTGMGFDIDDSQSVRVLNCSAIGCTTGFRVITTSTSTFCEVLNCHAESNTVGYDISAPSSSAILRNCSARLNGTGYTLAGIVYASGLTSDGNTTNYSGSVIPINIERGNWFFGSSGVVAPTARVHIVAGTTTAGSGPLKLTEGVNPTAAEDGLLNYVANNLTFTETTTVYTLAKTLTGTAALNFDLTSVNSQDLTITVTGAADGDPVSLAVPAASATANVIYTCWVSAANTVTVRASRIDVAAGADPASGTFRASVVKY